jgi:hypothetical protein
MVVTLFAACGGDDEQSDDALPITYASNYIQEDDTSGLLQPAGIIVPGDGIMTALSALARPPSSRAYVRGRPRGTPQAGSLLTPRPGTAKTLTLSSAIATTVRAKPGTRTWTYQIQEDGETILYLESGDPPPEGLRENASSP